RNGGNPAVVLLDLKMPKVDGLELLRRMRQDVRFRTVPVVVLTSSREESDIIQSYQLGVNAFVVKPVAFKEFVGAVKNLGLFWAVLNEPPPDRLQSPSPVSPDVESTRSMDSMHDRAEATSGACILHVEVDRADRELARAASKAEGTP